MKDLKNITAEDLPKWCACYDKNFEKKQLSILEDFVFHFKKFDGYDEEWNIKLASILSEVAQSAARQEAIGFIRWYKKNNWIINNTEDDMWINLDADIIFQAKINTEQLYDQYLLHLEQLKQDNNG